MRKPAASWTTSHTTSHSSHNLKSPPLCIRMRSGIGLVAVPFLGQPVLPPLVSGVGTQTERKTSV